ncbi:MAG: 3-deoxy-manno-octulosonate cytidylyltransferase [Verrucomicrobiota bacterium]|nr:3-deoxy-manno-octulosonate cytidylyltransferase [Verrucomicrobiota bacterium]
MSVICVIPARYRSSRFPGKLLVNILGKTLLQRTYESALRATSLDALYIATDSEEIKTHAEGFGAKVLWTSQSPLNGTERIAEAVSRYDELQRAKAILNLQGDHPCMPPETIDAVTRALITHPQASISTAARPIASSEELFSPHIVKCILDRGDKALYFSRSPIPYHKKEAPVSALAHLGIYCYTPSFLQRLPSFSSTPLQLQEDLEQLQFLELGFSIQVARVEKGGVSVDVPEDVPFLEKYLCLETV